MRKKKSSFHMGNEFNGHGAIRYLKGKRPQINPPVSQENVRLSLKPGNYVLKALGSIPVTAGKPEGVSELLVLLGSVPAVSQVMVKEDPDTGKYEISFTVPSTNKFTNNCYPYASRPAEPENFEGLGVVKEQGDKK